MPNIIIICKRDWSDVLFPPPICISALALQERDVSRYFRRPAIPPTLMKNPGHALDGLQCFSVQKK